MAEYLSYEETAAFIVMYLLALNLYIKLDAVWIDLDMVDINLDALLCSADADDYTNSFINLINLDQSLI